MQIGEIAKRAGVGVETVRFYERKSLLRSPQRKPSGYRIYGDQDLKRLLFIRQAKVLGFSLDDVREILAARGKGQCPCGTVIGIAERHLRETEQQIRNLTAFRDELRRSVSQWKKEGQQQVSTDAICTLIERTMQSRSEARKRQSNKLKR
jgi:DNA-binding transcriptional MerR regulator